jgi:hypothetical protein
VPVHYTRREPGVLDIFSEYSLKIPRIYSNMLEYIRIYSNILNISLSGGHGGLTGEAGGRTDNPVCNMHAVKVISNALSFMLGLVWSSIFIFIFEEMLG